MESQNINNNENKSESPLDKKIETLDSSAKEVSRIVTQKENSLSQKAKDIIERMNVVFLHPLWNLVDKIVLNEQFSQQEKTEKYFRNDPTVEISSFYNDLEGSGSIDLIQELKNAGENENKIVLLISGIADYRDPILMDFQEILQTSPILTRLMLAISRLRPTNVSRYGLDIKKILKGDSVPGYIINTTKEIQKQLFNKKPVKVMVVRNANSNNLINVVQVGGENTVLAVISHGSRSFLRMTDKKVHSKRINAPEIPLRAFVQHTCGTEKYPEHPEMGNNFAKVVFGWDRKADPIDYLQDPLHPRVINTKTTYQPSKDKIWQQSRRIQF